MVRGKAEEKITLFSAFSCDWSDCQETSMTSDHTYVISGWHILVFTAGVSFFSVQQEVIDHLLLVLPAEKGSRVTEARSQIDRNWN